MGSCSLCPGARPRKLSAVGDPDSPLPSPESRLRNGDDVRAALFEAQEMVMPEIQEQIQDYR